MSQWDLQANETSVYFKNYVNDEVVEAVQKKFKEGYDTIYVSFDVIGRTRHERLSYQLGSRLRALYGPKVNIEVGYNYQCDIRWVTDLSQEVVEEESKKTISNNTDKLIDAATDGILEGDFEINPKIIDGENVSCSFCEYRDICYLRENNKVYINRESENDGN